MINLVYSVCCLCTCCELLESVMRVETSVKLSLNHSWIFETVVECFHLNGNSFFACIWHGYWRSADCCSQSCHVMLRLLRGGEASSGQNGRFVVWYSFLSSLSFFAELSVHSFFISCLVFLLNNLLASSPNMFKIFPSGWGEIRRAHYLSDLM